MLEELKSIFKGRERNPISVIVFELVAIFVLLLNITQPNTNLLSLIAPIPQVLQLRSRNASHEVFGFAPYWKFSSLQNIDFSVLTTFAYFGIPVNSDGTLDTTDQGYNTFHSDQATKIFSKAHSSGTRVVLTLTQMDNSTIESFLDNPDAQKNLVDQSISEVKDKRIDGINVDFEYQGNPGDDYRNKFTNFISNLGKALHARIPGSKLTISVYAASMKDPKIYDIKSLAKNSDGIFMMAYDFAVSGSDNAIPTSPLYGYKDGKYWYDVSTAVEDFLKVMPSDKLILGLPWYGYNYVVYTPEVKAETRPYWSWRGQPVAQQYSVAKNINQNSNGVSAYETGWDNEGKVGYKAYYDQNNGTWRMIFLEDQKSLGIKYDFAKNKSLAGVGIWALGFDEGTNDMWSVLKNKFGENLAKNNSYETGL